MIDNWRKSTFSANNATCVETGWTPTHIAYRDTKHPRPTLLIPHPAAHTFLTTIKSAGR